MNEFFREVDEEYRRDRIANFWRRYSGLVVGLLIVLVAGIGGWRYWQYAERSRAEAAAMQYQDAVALAAGGDGEATQKALETLATSGPEGYKALAQFRLAAEKGRQNAQDGATAFDALAANASVPANLQDLARLRAAMLRLDTAPDQALPALERLVTPGGIFRHTAREMLGLAALRRGDFDAAGRWFDQIAADRETPANLRSRLEIYAGLTAGGPVQITQ
ncbi:tetratricopeptide repeat protein [Salinarimonas soli]|uniref:Tetratricopeptide repeat protein n=1 Tax=Salinarimonas soli TaxID=1638099 RepID=A0A5B2W0L4_9HYPH|nr:tetratricopeptide repeat protein [Salinarimonas soli]KAA2244006.1 tetratricopeptide repeat protein [Salinarimonas soli]